MLRTKLEATSKAKALLEVMVSHSFSFSFLCNHLPIIHFIILKAGIEQRANANYFVWLGSWFVASPLACCSLEYFSGMVNAGLFFFKLFCNIVGLAS